MNRWRQVVDQVLNLPFTGPALAMTAGAATGMPTLQRRGDRALCLSAPLNTTTSALFRATVQLRPSGWHRSGRPCSHPAGRTGAVHRPARVAGPGRQRRFRPLHRSCGGLDPGTLEETEASVSRRRGRQAWSPAAGGHRRSATRWWAVRLDTAAGPSLLVTEAREFGRGFCGQPPACSFAGTTPCATPATQGDGSGWSAGTAAATARCTGRGLGSGSATGYPAPASWHTSTSRMASGPAT